MVATDNDGNAHVWDLRGGGFRTFVHVVGNEEGVSLTPDGRFIAAPVGNGAVLLNADTGEVVTRFAGHTAATLNADISPDGTLLATASADGTAKLWNLAAGRELLTLAGTPIS
jgi:WD40 repeat protein